MTDVAPLAEAVSGDVLLPDDDGYAAACAGFNLAIVPHPDVVVTATGSDDVAAAVRFAREQGMPVRVLATGHGGHEETDGGLLINVAALDTVAIDPVARTATVGGGTRWGAVIAAAAEHGLAPISGSSPTVGVVGLLLGGGLGPLARRYGVSSDRLVSLRVVTGTGELVVASADENPELFWALRGGKGGLGVVIEATVDLVPMPELYGGSITFDAADAEAVLDGWLAWAADADPSTTTSVGILRFPDLEQVPPPLRGRHVVSLRFAAPVDAAAGEALVAPLRALAPVFLDAFAPLPASDIARVHSDPTAPMPGWSRGFMLRSADAGLVRALLGIVGPGTDAPFLGVEIRQLGGAVATDVADGSATGGRENPYTVTIIGVPNPAMFASVLPAAYAGLREALAEWIAPTTTINWLSEPDDPAQFRAAWPAATFERLAEVRRRYDPDGVFSYGPSEG